MTDLPAPLTPPDCDLRGYDFMPLFGHRLFGSVFDAHASDAEFRSAIRLWWQAWQQCPAGSLPNDDAALCRLADFGRDTKAWLKVKEQALHGFILCSDGRLYHKLLCEEAKDAYERRRRERERKAQQRAKKDGGTGGTSGGSDPLDNTLPVVGTSAAQSAPFPRDVPRDTPGTSALTGQDRTGQDSREERTEASPPTPASSPADPPDVRTELWGSGLGRLRRVTGLPDKAARGLLGRFCKEARDDCALVSGLLFEAERDRPGDPVAWMTAAIQSRTGQRGGSAPQSKLGWMLQ